MAIDDSDARRDEDDDEGLEALNLARTPERLEELRAEHVEEVRQYLRDRQARREVVAATRTPLGQVIDWVPAAEKRADPPDEDRPGLEVPEGPAEGRELRPVEASRFELEEESAELGPPGTVPVLHVDPDAITWTGTLQEFLSKDGRILAMRPDGDGDGLLSPEDETSHKYAYSAQWVECFGTEGNVNAWDPYVQRDVEFSLGQTALARGRDAAKQTIEAGHQEYRQKYGDWVPHLFVFYTTNGYTKKGDNLGGYNEDVDGWVQVSDRVHPGATSSPLSSVDGPQYVMNLKWQLWRANWWLRVNGRWIGYYPASLFSSGGLRERAEKAAWYGEVVDYKGEGTTRTDMGNGHWPYEGWQRCAFMSNLRYQSNANGTMSRYDPGSVYASHPDCYDIEGHFDNTGSWGSYFWWGGSGRNSGCP
jgi:hypothetical protein